MPRLDAPKFLQKLELYSYKIYPLHAQPSATTVWTVAWVAWSPIGPKCTPPSVLHLVYSILLFFPKTFLSLNFPFLEGIENFHHVHNPPSAILGWRVVPPPNAKWKRQNCSHQLLENGNCLKWFFKWKIFLGVEDAVTLYDPRLCSGNCPSLTYTDSVVSDRTDQLHSSKVRAAAYLSYTFLHVSY